VTTIPPTTVLFLGGNGHAGVRLAPARRALAGQGGPFALVDVPYAGFELRPRAASLDAFLEGVAASVETAGGGALVYGTGIGGLFFLCLRARGRLLDVPTVLQAPVLWGLEARWFPRLMRLPGAARFAHSLFGRRAFQDRFLVRYLRRPLSMEMRALFFAGYLRCTAFPDFFRWLTPALLRELEAAFRADPSKLDGIRFWWGAHDAVVSPEELKRTEAALGRAFPVRTFPEWGHYPYLDDPEGWVAALTEEVRAARA
jgi:hypothetical protein